MHITKIFRNFALFALFAFNHQPRPEIFWRHSPLTFYIYNFNPIFNSIQRSELNYQFASNVQIELNWIKLGSIQSQLFELLRALRLTARDIYGGVSKKFPLPSHYIPLQQGYPVTQQHLHTNVGISAPEPIVTHGFNVHSLAVASEGSEIRDNYSISV